MEEGAVPVSAMMVNEDMGHQSRAEMIGNKLRLIIRLWSELRFD